MARNAEIKAHARDLTRQTQLAAALATREPEELRQVDTFFEVPTGRLKLREFGDGSGELIQYQRPDDTGTAVSSYERVPTRACDELKTALANALGVRAVVKKERLVHHAGRTRIHLDRVEGLGEFLELEVVLEPGESLEHGAAEARELMQQLEIAEEDLVATAYVDLLER